MLIATALEQVRVRVFAYGDHQWEEWSPFNGLSVFTKRLYQKVSSAH